MRFSCPRSILLWKSYAENTVSIRHRRKIVYSKSSCLFSYSNLFYFTRNFWSEKREEKKKVKQTICVCSDPNIFLFHGRLLIRQFRKPVHSCIHQLSRFHTKILPNKKFRRGFIEHRAWRALHRRELPMRTNTWASQGRRPMPDSANPVPNLSICFFFRASANAESVIKNRLRRKNRRKEGFAERLVVGLHSLLQKGLRLED